MTTSRLRIPFHEKLAFGLGNFMPTAVTATGGMAMYFYTDVAGLSAAFIGALLLLVRVVDAFWDIWVGRRVDATRSRHGQARPYLLWFAPVLAVAMVASFSVPPLQGAARTVYYVLAYITLWCAYSLIMIPFQAMLPMVAPDPDERLRVAGVGSFVQFIFVVGCAAGFPMLKDALSGGVPAQGFQRAATLFAAVGLAMTWLCFAFVRERVPPINGPRMDLKTDMRALVSSRAWRAGVLAQCALAALIGLPLASGVYYFAVVIGQPQLVGPFMGLGGIGLVLGVVLSDQLTRRICKKRVYVGSMIGSALVLSCMLAGGPDRLPLVFTLTFLANICLGVSAPISYSINGDIADDIERREGQRVVGTLVATINFSNKVGAGLCSAIVGLVLSATAYQAGAAQQPAVALQGVIALMSVIPALMALGVAAVMGWGYPLGRTQLQQLNTDLSQRRAAAATA
ncbi:MFS transporter [Pelomonas sp. KK5]|uniref:MFS transporter n=1 Tax=Pelomonas sp. KK5 TaxID=1855730 RepID=UPI00097C0C72|nr:glycoside-pentoside-hexuronide (GPH):cation symporter [Pelomonas sp. KK5]